jgi:hypothetical protein
MIKVRDSKIRKRNSEYGNNKMQYNNSNVNDYYEKGMDKE